MREYIDPDLFQSMEKFGSKDWNECFHCGNCTAICPLTEEHVLFPRKPIKYLQMGLKRELESCVEPWLCYYCGECSQKCPRGANPGELMMTLRRYLTAAYDWTGLARKIYTSKTWEFALIFLLSALVLVLFLLFHGPMTRELTPEGGVQLNVFAPAEIVHIGDMIMAATVSFFLISNIINMYFKIMGRGSNIKPAIGVYMKEFYSLIIHFASQWKFRKCDSRNYWIIHWLLMSGYVILFVLIVGYLKWFQTDRIYHWWHPQRIIGYYATFTLLLGIIYFSISRIKKDKERSRHSHISDWTFLVMLFLTVLTGILVHIFRISGLPVLTYCTYVLHLMVLFPMIMIEVPFSKWSHLAYRPFAIYFSNIKKAASAQRVPALAFS
jgi:quinone-modifying oxidoreductase subunit QmoC